MEPDQQSETSSGGKLVTACTTIRLLPNMCFFISGLMNVSIFLRRDE